jgi:hypothetical protein
MIQSSYRSLNHPRFLNDAVLAQGKLPFIPLAINPDMEVTVGAHMPFGRERNGPLVGEAIRPTFLSGSSVRSFPLVSSAYLLASATWPQLVREVAFVHGITSVRLTLSGGRAHSLLSPWGYHMSLSLKFEVLAAKSTNNWSWLMKLNIFNI